MGLYETFVDPPAMFRQAPFWFWNHALEPSKLAWQIDQLKEKGLGGFVMHARHGLITPYLSDEWFGHIRACCTRARALGMVPWAYDERDWPSGPAGGTVIADHANRLSYLRLDRVAVEAGQTVSLDDDVVAAYAVQEGAAPARIAKKEWKAPKGTRELLEAVRFECPAILWFESYLDTLNPEACRAFIRSTYDLHESKLGNLKDLGLAGFFTDEPALSTYPDDFARIPWTAGLAAAFQEKKGYDLLDRLPEMFTPGVAGSQVRYDYWDVATGLFESAFFEAIEAWCESRGLQLIGHPLGEEPLLYQFRCLGDIFRHLRHLHMPGMDHVTGTLPMDSPLGIVPKLVSSAALLAGKERVMTETFGESGWGLSLREMKWMADWQMVQGINYLIPHAFYYSIAERRKKDSPPSEFYQAPFWSYYRIFADYTARITAAITGGETVARVAVLYPMASVWADFVPGAAIPPEVQELEKTFAPLCRTLLELHRDFVVLDEEVFAKAQIDGSTFRVNGLTFDALVVPKLTALRAETYGVLRAMAGSCRVILTGTGRVRVLQARGGAQPESLDLGALVGVACIAETAGADLERELAGIVPDVVLENAPDVHCLHRRKEGKDVFFFANTTRERIATTASFEAVGRAEIWDPATGARTSVPGQRASGNRLVLPLELEAMGSRLIVIDPGQGIAETPVTAFVASRRIRVCHLWEFTPQNGNFYALRQWDFRIEMRHRITELRYGTSFVLSGRIANLRLILDGIPKYPPNVPDAARPLVAADTEAVVMVDGELVTEELPWEIDVHFRVLDLGRFANGGTHRIEIVVKNNGWFPQPGLQEYAWLAGDFAVDANGDSPRLHPVRAIRSGAWEKQGFPFFSGTGVYHANLVIPEDARGRRMFLDAGQVGDLLDVEVNGQDVGVCAWPPYRIELTRVLQIGANTAVLKVTNTLRNFLEGPNPANPSGLLDEVWLDIE